MPPVPVPPGQLPPDPVPVAEPVPAPPAPVPEAVTPPSMLPPPLLLLPPQSATSAAAAIANTLPNEWFLIVVYPRSIHDTRPTFVFAQARNFDCKMPGGISLWLDFKARICGEPIPPGR